MPLRIFRKSNRTNIHQRFLATLSYAIGNDDVNATTTLHFECSKIVRKELIAPSCLIVLSYM